jgi:hypothetical protein
VWTPRSEGSPAHTLKGVLLIARAVAALLPLLVG